MGLVGMSRKNKIKNVYLLKMSLSVQIGGEIQALLCFDDSIKISIK